METLFENCQSGGWNIWNYELNSLFQKIDEGIKNKCIEKNDQSLYTIKPLNKSSHQNIQPQM